MADNAVGTYGMSGENLQQIIAKTHDALAQMDRLHSSVMQNTDAIGSANRSVSGTTTTGNLSLWAQDFATVRRLLDELNNKAQNLFAINQNAAETAAATSK